MAEIQHHRQLPLATIHENSKQASAVSSDISSPTSQQSTSTLNPACQTFAPKATLMESLEFYKLPADAEAIFSTQNGKYEKRSMPTPLPLRIARSDVAKDVDAKFNILWDKYRLQLHDMKTLHNHQEMYRFFDAVDLYTEGRDFCWMVVTRLSEHSQMLGTQTHFEVDALAKDWVKHEYSKVSNFHVPDVTVGHQDFSPANVAYWEHEEDLALLRRAINHYVGERQREDQYNHYQQHSARAMQSHTQGQYGGVRGRGGYRNYSNQHSRQNSRKSPPREQSSNQHSYNSAEISFGQFAPIRVVRHSSEQCQVWHQSLDRQLEKKAYGLVEDDLGEQFEVTYSGTGNPTLIYDGETKEAHSFVQPALTVYVSNFTKVPGYFEDHLLKRLFSQCGQVVAVSYVDSPPYAYADSPPPPPYAFVVFKHPLSAEAAINRFHGYQINNTELTVRAKITGRQSRSGSGASINNAPFAGHRRGSMKEQQFYPPLSAPLWSDALPPLPVLNEQAAFSEQPQRMPLGSIKNLPQVRYSQQDARAAIPSMKEDSPIKDYAGKNNKSYNNENSPIKENNEKNSKSYNNENLPLKESHGKNSKSANNKKGSGKSTPSATPLRSRSVVRSDKQQENQNTQSDVGVARDDAILTDNPPLKTEFKNNENTRPSDSMQSGSSTTGNTKAKKGKNKKGGAKNDDGHPDPNATSFNIAPSESSELSSLPDPFSPDKDGTTPRTSFSTNSSKAPSFALSDRGRGPANLRSVVATNKDSSSQKKAVDVELQCAADHTEGFQEKMGMGKKGARGHSKNTSSNSVFGEGSARKADEHKRGNSTSSGLHGGQKAGGKKTVGQNAGEEISDGENTQGGMIKKEVGDAKIGGGAITQTEGSVANTDATLSKEDSTETTPAPSVQAKSLEPSDIKRAAARTPEPAVSPSTTSMDDSKAISTVSATTSAPSTEKKKARVRVAIPLNFSGRPQPFVVSSISRWTDKLDELGSPAWPYIKSSRPI